MTPEEISATYEVLAPMAGDYANANIERAGQAQSSYGPLAQAAMGGSQTAGVGNYTYNRLVRPAVDTLRDQLIVEGLSASLNKQISDSLDAAKKNYQRAYSNYSRSSGGGTTGNSGTAGGDLTIDEELLDDIDTDSTGGYSSDGSDTVSTLPSTAKEGEYNVGTATVNGETRIVTKEKNGNYHIQGVGSYPPNGRSWKDAQKEYNVKLNPYPGANAWLIF